MEKSEIIAKLNEIYHDKDYSYEFITDSNLSSNVTVVCDIHGKFSKRLNRLLSGSGCPKCSGKTKKTTEEFISDAKEVHGDKYDYSKVNYINATTKVNIICHEHGEFLQTPTNHLSGNGCPKCKIKKLTVLNSSNTDEFMEKGKKVHNGKYDYSKVKYINNTTKVCIICPKHGEFWQTPMAHLSGRGCALCRESHLEKEIRNFLNEKKIKYMYQWHLPWKKYYSLDFYLPDYNVGIECQGGQHFKPVDKYQGEEGFVKTIKLDFEKKKKCEDNNLPLYYYSNIKYNFPYKVYVSKEKLLKEIKGG